MTDITRWRFVKTIAGTGAAFTILPRHVLGRGMQAPSDTVNIAAIGIGGRGGLYLWPSSARTSSRSAMWTIRRSRSGSRRTSGR